MNVLKLKKILLLFAVLSLLSTSFFNEISFSKIEQSGDIGEGQNEINDKAAIIELLSSYFDTRYKIMSTLVMDENVCNYFLQSDEKANRILIEEKHLIETIIEHRKMQINDLKYSNYSYDLFYKDIAIDGIIATIILEESCLINFNFIPDINTEMKGLVHTITLKKENHKWFILEDKYSDEFKVELDSIKKKVYPIKYESKESFSENELEIVKSLYLKKSKKHVNEIKELQMTSKARQIERSDLPTEINKSVKSNSLGIVKTSSLTFNNYNWYNAVSYAREYAKKINSPPWGNYESMGGDCTNFISQCLYNGNIPFDTSGSSDNYKWYWYSDSNRVPPWTGASQFYTYATNNNTSSSSNYGLKATETDWASMYQGDIVQLGSTPYHSMIISQVVWSSQYPPVKTDFLICQHSVGESGRLLDYPLSSKPTPSHYISINGYYK